MRLEKKGSISVEGSLYLKCKRDRAYRILTSSTLSSKNYEFCFPMNSLSRISGVVKLLSTPNATSFKSDRQKNKPSRGCFLLNCCISASDSGDRSS